MAYEAEDRQRLRRAGLFAAGSVAAVIAVFVWANHVDRSRNPERTVAERTQGSQQSLQPKGTTGNNALPGARSAQDTIRELDVITNAPDASGLVGRRVDLRTKVSDVASDMAFWVGPQQDRVLVIVGRNDQLERRNSSGELERRGVTTVRPGQPLSIVGTVQAMPNPKQRSKWGGSEEAPLENHAIYIRADTVIPR